MDAPTITTMCCTACGALADAKCACGVSYEPLSKRVERRKEKAAELYKQGQTMEEIADKLKVSRPTISEDLSNLSETDKLKRPKTATNPKGAGRPKGRKTKTPGVKQAQRSIDLHPEAWAQIKADAIAKGMTVAAYIGEKLDEPIDPRTLAKSAQEKLAAALRQQQRKQNVDFERIVQAEVTKRNQEAFPRLQEAKNQAYESEQRYREFLAKQKKIMTPAEFTLVCSLLHPDSRASASEERLRRAFQMFEPKKFALTGEK